MPPLPEREREVLTYLRRGIERDGRAPTGPELGSLMGVSHVTAYKHLHRLAERGLVDLRKGSNGEATRVRLTDRGRAALGSTRALPRFGRIPAGPLTDVVAQADDFVSGIDDLIPGIREGDYLLDVEGESMIKVGIRPGMTLVMRPDVTPSSGAICSVYVEGEGNTLKRVEPRGGRVTLAPENDALSPQTYPADQVTVQGVLVAAVGVTRFL